MTNINAVRKALKSAGFWQYESYGVGKCGIASEFGDFQVKEEGRVVYYGKRANRRRTEKTGRMVVLCRSHKHTLDEMAQALAKVGIATEKISRTSVEAAWELNWETGEALIVA